MTEHERKIKRRVQIIVAGTMAVFFCLLLTLTIQLSVMANQRRLERSLKASQARLESQIKDTGKSIDYYNSDKFIDEYALREFGYGREGSKIFK